MPSSSLTLLYSKTAPTSSKVVVAISRDPRWLRRAACAKIAEEARDIAALLEAVEAQLAARLRVAE